MKKVFLNLLAVVLAITFLFFLAMPAKAQSKKELAAAINQLNRQNKDLAADNEKMAEILAALDDFRKNMESYNKAYDAAVADLEATKYALVAKADTVVGLREDLKKANDAAKKVGAGGKPILSKNWEIIFEKEGDNLVAKKLIVPNSQKAEGEAYLEKYGGDPFYQGVELGTKPH